MLMTFQSTLQAGTAPTKAEITKLYVATFNRAPDAGGAEWWATQGLTLKEIATFFFDSSETKEEYPPGSTTSDFVEAVYLNLFNRADDPEGVAYWANEIDLGNITRAELILFAIDTDSASDAAILANKTTVGLAFADAGLSGIADAKDIIAGITDKAYTVARALQRIIDRNALVHQVDNLRDLRKTLNDIALNGLHDVIELSKGIYNISDDGRGPLSVNDEESFTLMLKAAPGLSSQDVILKSNETERILTYNNTEASTLTIQGITITGGKASNGAGIFSTSNMVINDCNISHNNGVGLYTNGHVTVYNSSINDNNGTGFIAQGTTTTEVTNTTVARNKEGGFYAEGSVSVDNAQILDNYLYGKYDILYGSGFYAAGDVDVRDSNVSGNYLKSAGSSKGAGFYAGGNATVINSVFSDNILIARNFASYGSGFYVQQHVDVEDCIFTHNTMSSHDPAKGAGFLAARAYVKNSIFSNNGGDGTSAGGGFYVYYPSTVINSKFINNGAEYGGAFSVKPEEDRGGANVINSVFVNNSADHGSAIYSRANPYNVINSQFIGHAYAPAIISYGNFINNIFDGNDLDLECRADSSIHSTYIDETKILAADGIVVTKQNNIDPYYDGEVFLNDDNITLEWNSPVIDQGLNADSATFIDLIGDKSDYNTIIGHLQTDILGNQRVHNGTIDMGAAEFSSN